MFIKRTITLGMVLFISACSSKYLPRQSCAAAPQPDQDNRIPTDIRSENTKRHGCSEFDAAINIAAAVAIESTKSDSCNNKSGKARKRV